MNETEISSIGRRKFLNVALGLCSLLGLESALAFDSEKRLSFLTSDGLTLPPIPGLWGKGVFRALPYIQAAMELQRLQPEDRASVLLAHATKHRYDYRVLVLCRMLFSARDLAANGFRRPYIGGGIYLGDTDNAQWPFEPIEVVDGVPFLISKGYVTAGSATESALDYLKYCISDCEPSSVAYEKKDSQELSSALKKLVSDKRWKRPLTPQEVTFLREQIQ